MKIKRKKGVNNREFYTNGLSYEINAAVDATNGAELNDDSSFKGIKVSYKIKFIDDKELEESIAKLLGRLSESGWED